MATVHADKAYFIKLGEKGVWEKDCIDNDYLILDYKLVPHHLCQEGKWSEVRDNFPYGGDSGSKTRHLNQVRRFYEEPESTLWITFYGDSLYWCFSMPEITYISNSTDIKKLNSKTRPVIGKWSRFNVNGIELLKSRISGKLLATQKFQGTICEVRELKYLLHKINGTLEPHVEAAGKAKEALVNALQPIIKNLHEKDLEILIDLIFRNAGFQRTGVVGGTEKNIDLDLISPLTNERLAIEVKSRANLSTFLAYKESFESMPGFTYFYFVTHSASQELTDWVKSEVGDNPIIFWNVKTIAENAVNNGLVGWLINKAT